MKTYSELVTLSTFEERFNYLKLDGVVGEETFGYDRYLNQMLYRTKEWRALRNEIIIRDDGCDLGIPDRKIFGRILIHHINPITIDDIQNRNSIIFDPENLITTTKLTHDAIHFGDQSLLIESTPIVRKPNDTCPWR